MKNLVIIFTYFALFISCKKEQNSAEKNIASDIIKIDTITIEDKDQVIFISPTISYLDSIKTSYKNIDDFYTMADDANFYIAEARNYILKNNIDTYNIQNNIDTYNIQNNKVLKIGNKTIKISQYKPWTLILYQKGDQPKNIYPVDIEEELTNYYSIHKNTFNSIESILQEYNLNPTNILYKNEFNIHKDDSKDYVLIIQNNDKKTILLIKQKNGKYSLNLKNDEAIPCEECGNGAESFYDYKIENGFLSFSSSLKSNETIYQINFQFKNDSSFILNQVEIHKSKIGESSEEKIVLDKNKFGLIKIEDFNYSNFLSKYVI